MELDSRKKSRRDRMMRSKSFDTQEVKEIGRKEAGESRGFPILCMRIMEEVFQMEWKEWEDQERLKSEENPCQSEEGALAWDRQLCLGRSRWTRGGWRQPQKIQREWKESKRTSETPQGMWLGGAQRGSLWPCYAGPLAEKRESGILGKRHRPKPIPWEKNSWES